MAAFGKSVAVQAAYASPGPDIDCGFTPRFLQLKSTTGSFFYSFDGINDHGVIAANTADVYNHLTQNNGQKIWLKQNGGAATCFVTALG